MVKKLAGGGIFSINQLKTKEMKTLDYCPYNIWGQTIAKPLHLSFDFDKNSLNINNMIVLPVERDRTYKWSFKLYKRPLKIVATGGIKDLYQWILESSDKDSPFNISMYDMLRGIAYGKKSKK